MEQKAPLSAVNLATVEDEGQRRKHFRRLNKICVLFLVCCIGCLVVGIETQVDLEQSDLQVWEKIHIVAYMIATISCLLVFIINIVHKRETELHVNDSIGCFSIVLWCGLFCFGLAIGFLGLFIDTTKVFSECTDPSKTCFRHLMPYTIVFIVMLVLFFTGLVLGCCQQHPDTETFEQMLGIRGKRVLFWHIGKHGREGASGMEEKHEEIIASSANQFTYIVT